MLTAEYIYRGKELRPKLELKLNKLLLIKDQKQKELDKFIAETPLLQTKPVWGKLEEFGKDDPKMAVEAAISEIKFQINKCTVLILECQRSPRMKFILDLEEIIWLYN